MHSQIVLLCSILLDFIKKKEVVVSIYQTDITIP